MLSSSGPFGPARVLDYAGELTGGGKHFAKVWKGRISFSPRKSAT